MRLQDNPYLPNDLPGLVRQLDALYRQIATQLNQVSEGRVHAATNASTAPPTTGEWLQGDFIRNSAPVESGGSVLYGWICVASGEPGTWRPCHFSTGG